MNIHISPPPPPSWISVEEPREEVSNSREMEFELSMLPSTYDDRLFQYTLMQRVQLLTIQNQQYKYMTL